MILLNPAPSRVPDYRALESSRVLKPLETSRVLSGNAMVDKHLHDILLPDEEGNKAQRTNGDWINRLGDWRYMREDGSVDQLLIERSDGVI